MARRFTGVRRAGPRHNYDWEGATTNSIGLASGSVTSALLFTSDSSETLVRVRGVVNVDLTFAASAAGDIAVVACGLIVHSSPGTTVGVDPITEAGADWLWHQFFIVSTRGVIGAVADSGQQATNQRVIVDNKAMRKLREDQAISFIVANQDGVGAPTVDVTGAFRVLTQR